MLQARVFPCLLLKGEGLVKTIGFRNPTYIGDPINAVRIFNTKEVDELLFLDITASAENRRPNIELIKKISDECTMPLTVGGGIKTIEDINSLLNSGVEKVAINTAFFDNPQLIKDAADNFGSQAVIVSIDVKRNWNGTYEVYVSSGTKRTGINLIEYVKKAENYGAGEILINSIDRDGTMKGFDVNLIKKVTASVNIPVIACGGCGKVEDIKEAVTEGGASAVTAGSFFIFHGKRRAVLINFPTKKELQAVLS